MKKKINLAIFTVGRSDYGIMRNIIIESQKSEYFRSTLFVAGNHKSTIFGKTIQEIKKDKLKKIVYFSENYKKSKENKTIDHFSHTLLETQKKIKNFDIDYALILGDRYEMMAISLVCFNKNIKIIHFCGGSDTLGAHDDKYRYSISKMSFYHFVETPEHKKRLNENGIKKNIKIMGAPALENLDQLNFLTKEKICKKLNIKNCDKRLIITTFHPETHSSRETNKMNLKKMLRTLVRINENLIITYPNADDGYFEYLKIIQDFKRKYKNIYVFKNLGVKMYYNLLHNGDLLTGNSSSGIIESAAFKIPTINIGIRQKKRYAPINVIHSSFNEDQLLKKIKFSLSSKFKKKIKNIVNPYRLRFKSKKFLQLLKKIDEK